MKYEILTAEISTDLEKLVVAKLAAGWYLIGGLIVIQAPGRDRLFFYQAVGHK